jgi:nicotinamidase/pyrazinamidase
MKKKILSFDIDAQKGFTPLCPNELPVTDGDSIVAELNAQAALADLRAGSKDWHPANALHIATAEHPQFSAVEGVKNIDVRWNRHCTGGTVGAELLDGLPTPEDYDYFVWKGMEPSMHPYGACYHDLADKQSTGVIEWAKAQGVTHVVVGGLATDYCVATTVRQLVKAGGFTVVVNLGACRGIWATKTQDDQVAEFLSLGCKVVNTAAEIPAAL